MLARTPWLSVVFANAAADQSCIVRLGDDLSSYINATRGGNMSRYINHSCAPNVYRHTVSSSTQIAPRSTSFGLLLCFKMGMYLDVA